MLAVSRHWAWPLVGLGQHGPRATLGFDPKELVEKPALLARLARLALGRGCRGGSSSWACGGGGGWNQSLANFSGPRNIFAES